MKHLNSLMGKAVMASVALAGLGLSSAQAASIVNVQFVPNYVDVSTSFDGKYVGPGVLSSGLTWNYVKGDGAKTAAASALKYDDGSASVVAVTASADGVDGGERGPVEADKTLLLSNGLHANMFNAGSVTISGLNVSKTYDLVIFARTWPNGTTAIFGLDGVQKTADASQYDSFAEGVNYVQYASITPHSDGTIAFTSGFDSGDKNVWVPGFQLSEAVPEPTSLGVLGLGVVGLIARRRR